MKIPKRVLSLILSVLVVGGGVSYINALDTPTLLTQDATLMDIVVPLSFPINVDSKGLVTVADNTKVVNNSYGAIEVTGVNVTPKNEWILSSFNKDYSTEKVGTKEFGFKIDEIDLSNIQSKIEAKQVKAGGELLLNYNANIPPQKDIISSSNIADVVLTINWSGISLSNELVGTYYPELADKWETKTSMPTLRYQLTSSEVNGKIYAIGGYNESRLSTLEVYDPKTDKWETKTSMPTKRENLTSSEVGDKIYVIGGISSNGDSNKVEVYDTITDSWEEKARMPTVRGYLTSQVVDGKIYCIGGYGIGTYYNKVEVYDPKTDSWEEKASMPTARYSLTSSEVDGKIYCIGGYGRGGYLNKVEVYDTITDTWEEKTPMPTARFALTSQVVGDKIYIIGGGNNANSNKVEVYDTKADSWETKASMPTATGGLTSSVTDGKIYCIGGISGSGKLNTVEVYDTGWRYN